MTEMPRFRAFVESVLDIIARHSGDEPALLAQLTPELAALVAQDDWLPEAFAHADPQFYRQYLLYADPLERVSIVSIAWAPGQKTPIHDHNTWCLVGALRGAQLSTVFEHTSAGSLIPGETVRLTPGMITANSPNLGDIHTIQNAYDDRVSVSIHVYGGNIGRIERATYNAVTGETKPVFSRFANAQLPQLFPA